MGRSFDLTDFMGPSISLLHNESINNEEKAIFIILLNSKIRNTASVSSLMGSIFNEKKSCISHANTIRPKVKT